MGIIKFQERVMNELKEDRDYGVTVFRMVIAMILVKDFAIYIPNAENLFGYNGIFPYKNFVEVLDIYNLGFIANPIKIPILNKVFLITGFLLSIMFFVGYKNVIVGLLLALLLLYYKFRNIYLLDGADNVISVIILFVALSDSKNIFVNKFHESKNSSNWKKLMPVAIMIQIAIVYFFASLHKLGDNDWINGTALYYATSIDDFKWTALNDVINNNPWFIKITSYTTIMWELLFVLVFLGGRIKIFILTLSIIFHIGIFIMMRIDNYSVLMIASYAVFLTNLEIKNIMNFFSNKNWHLTLKQSI